jgi:hypothetical protein
MPAPNPITLEIANWVNHLPSITSLLGIENVPMMHSAINASIAIVLIVFIGEKVFVGLF